MLWRSVPKLKNAAPLLIETFRLKPNSEAKPSTQPALVLESLWDGHPAKGTIVGGGAVLHTRLARFYAIAAPFT